MRQACWVLCDYGKIGTLNQVKALAEKVVGPGHYTLHTIRLPQRFLQSCMLDIPGVRSWILKTNGLAGKDPPPLIIAAGRWSSYVSYYYRHQSTLIALLSPGIHPNHFHAIVAPFHDTIHQRSLLQCKKNWATVLFGGKMGVDPPHLIGYNGALHEFSSLRLYALTAEQGPWPAHLQRPFVGVLVGGDSHHLCFTKDLAAKLIGDLQQWVQRFFPGRSCSVLVTTSRRTPVFFVEMLEKSLSQLAIQQSVTRKHHPIPPSNWWIFKGDGANPYPFLLAQSDVIIVTSDSISMVAEAASRTLPTLVYDLGIKDQKFQHFLQTIMAQYFATPFQADASSYDQVNAPLYELDAVANELRHLLAMKKVNPFFCHDEKL